MWTVIRLLTDEKEVHHFYNSLDFQLEISLECLDDIMAEAKQVYKHNPWITYSQPLHRLRELGYHDRLFDLIDERPLTLSEVRSFCCFIFGLKVDGPENSTLPDPAVYPDAFLRLVETYLDKEQLQYNPIKKTMTPWFIEQDMKKLFGVRKRDKLISKLKK